MTEEALLYLIQGIAAQIAMLVGPQSQLAVEFKRYEITNNLAQVLNNQDSPTFGLFALLTKLNQIIDTMASNQTALMAAIGAPQQSGVAVTLPAAPPSTFSQANANAVWGVPDTVTGGTMGSDLNYASAILLWLAEVGAFPAANTGFFTLGGRGLWEVGPVEETLTVPHLDLTVVTPGQSLQSALDAQNPGFNWYPPSGDNSFFYSFAKEDSRFLWTCTLSVAQYAALTGGSSVKVPPMWPGLAGVTLGASVALSDGLSVAGPLDGVIVKITSVPNPIGYYGFGGRKSFVHVGGIIFLDDNGEAEQSQPLGLDDEVIVPRAMTGASSAVLRLKSGVVGTVQPWTLK